MLPPDLRHFTAHEFTHPDAVDSEAAYFLDEVRTLYDNPLIVTDDARTPEEVAARQNAVQGGSATSLHASGRAFDLRFPPSNELVFKLVRAICAAERNHAERVELEIDVTEGNKHFHIGLRPYPTGSTLMLRKAK